MSELTERQQLRQSYLQQKDRAGIVRVMNRAAGRSWLGASPNAEAALNRLQFELKMRQHRNRQLQQDYLEFGAACFDFDVLEKICLQDRPGWNLDEELELALSLWQTELAGTAELLKL